MNLLNRLESFKTKERHVAEIMSELNSVLQKDTAEHFIQWHNSKANEDRHISQSWYNLYLTENGKQ